MTQYKDIAKFYEKMKLSKQNPEGTIPSLDDKIEKAARYIAVAYDKLGFILKHDEDLE